MHPLRHRRALASAILVATLVGGAVQAQDDGQWTLPGKDFAATRYSGLTEITPPLSAGSGPCGPSPPASWAVTRRSR